MKTKAAHGATHATLEQLLRYRDRELSSRQAKAVHEHLDQCSQCQAKLARIDEISTDTAPVLETDTSFENAQARAYLQACLRASPPAVTQSADPAPAATHLRYARTIALLSAAAVLITLSIGVANRPPADAMRRYAGLLPDPVFTPGSTRPVDLAEICSSRNDEVVRDVPASLQGKVFAEYGLRNSAPGDFEVDYLITPGLGGSDDVRNLWPEPHHTAIWNSYVKDQLEDHLHHLVCGNRVSLQEAQTAIATDWIAAYKKYFHTNQPVSNPAVAALQPGMDSKRSIASQASFTASSLLKASFTSAARSAKRDSSSNRLSAAAAVWDE